jgi:hypothetical protein
MRNPEFLKSFNTNNASQQLTEDQKLIFDNECWVKYNEWREKLGETAQVNADMDILINTLEKAKNDIFINEAINKFSLNFYNKMED